MNDDFSKYQGMKERGQSPEQVYLEAVHDGVDNISRIRLIRSVFSFTFEEYKEVWVRAEGIANSLSDHIEKVAEQLRDRRLE